MSNFNKNHHVDARIQEKQNNNPANEPEKSKVQRKRVPMSIPHLKLAVPEIPGYHCHWMRGSPDRIQQALDGGYEFASNDDINIINTGFANSSDDSGNTDMGTRVSNVAGGGMESSGQPLRLYLMKIREEWWLEDQEVIARRSEMIAEKIRGINPMEDNPHGQSSNYAKHTYGARENRNILQPRLRRQTPESE